MADVIISFTPSGDEIPASITLLTLKDANTGIAVTVTPALPQAFALSGGVFTYTFPDTGASLYAFTYRLTWDDSTHQDESSTRRGLVPAGTHYSSRAAIEAAAGVSNLNIIADLQKDGDSTYIATRIEAALVESDSNVNVKFAIWGVAVPTSGVFLTRLATIGAYYALVYLYRPRAMTDRKFRRYLETWQDEADKEVGAIAWSISRSAAASGAAVITNPTGNPCV
jgi:hypothetical protein